ncbi:NAD-dependent epimerase/dehydratase family protein [Candidatus Neomarinimicrobiota bacterium]
MSQRTAIILGGSGFVGTHLVQYTFGKGTYDVIIVGDLVEPLADHPSLIYIPCDVRQPIDLGPFLPYTQDAQITIYNLAALCHVPGYPDEEYFNTNILGAEIVCKFAEAVGCSKIVFTSSIAVYGTSELVKTEETLTQPNNPYGISKLVAEKIHMTWQASVPERNLHILRPGIIFGKGENANFTRLYKAITGRYFFYPGRQDTLKASVYVKDVAAACYYFAENMDGMQLYNLCYPTPPTIAEICNTIASVIGVSPPRITVPASLLLAASSTFQAFLKLFGKKNINLHPDRVKKLMISTNVSGKNLLKLGFTLRYPLAEALVDWLKDNEGKGLF